MKEIIVYEMIFNKRLEYEYMKIYNECFHKMRNALEIEPINYYYDYSQIQNKINDIFLYLQHGAIVGSVSCYGNELDDLIVAKSFQRQGTGQKLLLWGMNQIKERGYEEIVLHVAEWNQEAVQLYLKNGFIVKKKEKVR